MRKPSMFAAALAFAVCAAGIRWGAMVAGGSDSYGYVSQAGLWLQGLPIVRQEIVAATPWPDAAETWSPLGYRPSPHQRDELVPIYAPGLPLLMALFQAVGGYCAAYLVVPLSGAATVWFTFVLGRRIVGNEAIALWAALLVATSPVFIYQLMNAMSDVPVTAFCTLGFVLAVMGHPVACGLALGATILVRPNLAPIAAVVGGWLVLTRGRGTRFVIGIVPAVICILWLNSVWYESPFVSGYGTTSDLYSMRFFSTNVRQFVEWLVEVETPLVLLGALFLCMPRWFPPASVPHARLLLGGWVGVVAISYVFYQPFDVWWYLRFLLPMWPPMMVSAAVVLIAAAKRADSRLAPVALAAFLAAHGVYLAAQRGAFTLGRTERRYIDVGRFVRSHTEPDAVMLSVQHSGSLRLYGDRLTLRYVVLDPLWLDRAVAHLAAIGRHPYFVLDGAELDEFRRRFGAANQTGRLEWQPMATLGQVVAIYDPVARQTTPPLAIAQTRGARAWPCDPPQSWPPVRRMK